MKKLMEILTAAVFSAALLCSCGKSGFDFSQTELTDAMGIKKAYFDEMEIQPDDDGETGNELFEQAKALGGADFYTYWLEQDASEENFDVVRISFYSGKVNAVSLTSWGGERSEHTILGVRTGASREEAEKILSDYFGAEGSAMSDDKEVWGLTDMDYDYITFGNYSDKKGVAEIVTDVETDTVIKVEYMK